jgi:hypothetical protein
MRGNLLLSPSAVRRCGSFSTALEPASLVDAFMQHPPEGFTPLWIESGSYSLPSFRCSYDLRTTLDEDSGWIKPIRQSEVLGKFTRLPSLFLGTTVSEYAPIPSVESFDQLLWTLERTASGAQLIIIKDLPWQSPLLPAHANQHAQQLLAHASAKQYLNVHGQALAYVPINFSTLDEYMSALSHSRRKEFRKKLRTRALMTLEELETGSAELCKPDLVAELYALYVNVYNQSRYHFDRLSFEFFTDVLSRRDSGGIVFVYRRGKTIVGFNLCFVHNGILVDKYIGFRYPEARELNLYFVSWFSNLEFALRHRLTHYIAGWTDPEVKAALGARFTSTRHAVRVVNPALRAILAPFQRLFEPDAGWDSPDEVGP